LDVDDALTELPSSEPVTLDTPWLPSETAAAIPVDPVAATDSPLPAPARAPDNVTLGVSANAPAGKTASAATTDSRLNT
jgi:hypothetical protein